MKLIGQRVFASLFVVALAGAWLAPDNAHGETDDDLDMDGEESLVKGPESRLGIGLRLRQVYLPEAMLELFLEDVPGSASHIGYGIELIREKGNFIISLGAEYESIAAAEGVWIDKGESIPQDEPDYVQFKDFSWLTFDALFTWQQPLHSTFSLRAGAGVGLGILMGEILRTDYRCTSDDTGDCSLSPTAQNINTPESAIPPVFPVINVVVGAQIRPAANLAINIEGGIRTVPFVGTTVALLF